MGSSNMMKPLDRKVFQTWRDHRNDVMETVTGYRYRCIGGRGRRQRLRAAAVEGSGGGGQRQKVAAAEGSDAGLGRWRVVAAGASGG